MNSFKSLSTLFKLAATVMCLALLLPVSVFVGRAQVPAGGRSYEARTFKDAPVVVTDVRNLQRNDENWFRDLEIEVKNVSQKPVYYILLVVGFPDAPLGTPERRADGSMPAKVEVGFGLD
jgi:hypothetical protein